jgi:hypothetical protein
VARVAERARGPSPRPMREAVKPRQLLFWLEGEWSGRRDSNPRPTAWKAVTLPLSYSRESNATNEENGGGGRIRTSVGRSPADLQSAAIVHSATPPKNCLAPDRGLEPAPGFEPGTYGLQDRSSTPELCRRVGTQAQQPRRVTPDSRSRESLAARGAAGKRRPICHAFPAGNAPQLRGMDRDGGAPGHSPPVVSRDREGMSHSPRLSSREGLSTGHSPGGTRSRGGGMERSPGRCRPPPPIASRSPRGMPRHGRGMTRSLPSRPFARWGMRAGLWGMSV